MSELLKIGEVSKLCDISIKTLRFYEEEKLIKPVKVDIYSGYRFYDDESIMQIYKVKFLRDLGFSIKEIREFNQNSINDKIKEIESQIDKLKDNRQMLSFLNKQKGEKIMKNFVNDKEAIGKWKYVASTESKEAFLKGESKKEKDAFIKNLYFLPEGEGYWIFERWTKGMIMQFRGEVYTYEICGNKLFLKITHDGKEDGTYVFEKVDSKEYSSQEIAIKDNLDLPFVMDKKILGLWEAVDFIKFEEKKNYQPKKYEGNLIFRQATFNPNGEAIFEATGGFSKKKWTKGKILDKAMTTVSDYVIKTIDGQTYLIMDWKSGDYTFNGDINGCYVFKKFN